jgi:trehalose 6-phosphate phosphatase
VDVVEMTSTATAVKFVGESGVDVERALRRAEASNVALFLDVDGTLIDLAERPTAVVVPPELLDTLERADRKLEGALALVSGRTIDDIDHLFSPLRLRASGVHGAQIRLQPGDGPLLATASGELPAELWSLLNDALFPFSRILVENKRFSFAVHYRQHPEVAPRLLEVLKELTATAPWEGIDIEDAHFAFELKPPNFDKGKAIALFLERAPFLGRMPIFIGDDTTDESGFAAVSARGGLAFSVGGARPGAVGIFDAPQNVRNWLAAFATTGDPR